MAINVRTKGQTGEREVAKILNRIIGEVRGNLELPQYAKEDELFQRNQNQSAVGGSDLSSPMPLEFEVKRQEALSINTWWKQTLAAAKRVDGIPILIYRQNNKKWRVIMYGELPLLHDNDPRYLALPKCRVEIDLPTFEQWFSQFYFNWLSK